MAVHPGTGYGNTPALGAPGVCSVGLTGPGRGETAISRAPVGAPEAALVRAISRSFNGARGLPPKETRKGTLITWSAPLAAAVGFLLMAKHLERVGSTPKNCEGLTLLTTGIN